MGTHNARRLSISLDGFVHRPVLARVQHSAHLPAGRRPDSSLAPVVSAGPCPQPAGGHGSRNRGTGCVHWYRCVVAVNLARAHFHLPSAELLGRSQAGPPAVATGKNPAPPRLRMPQLPDGAADRPLLEVQWLWTGL